MRVLVAEDEKKMAKLLGKVLMKISAWLPLAVSRAIGR